ncbi:MAG: RimK family alpha-L-glutamate ligase [Bacteroidota bacterium]
MRIYSLAIAWNWEHDADFVRCIANACQSRKISVLNLQPNNLNEILAEIRAGRVTFQSFYDRASDDDDEFLSVVDAIKNHDIVIINPHSFAERAKDKAAMHGELSAAGLRVPFTIIIPPYNRNPQLDVDEHALEKLRRPFVIKPAVTTGGGTGVILRAESLQDVIDTRQHHKDDKYLLQEQIRPVLLDGGRAWFRVFYAFGETIICWWDDRTHIYRDCLIAEEKQFGLTELRTIILKIQAICNLDFFSSEIALNAEGNFIVIDYVNEICDMRFQSRFEDGVPDAVVHRIVNLLVDHIAAKIAV